MAVTPLLVLPPTGKYVVPMSMSENEIPEFIRWLKEDFGGETLAAGYQEFGRAWQAAGPQQRYNVLMTCHPWFFGLRVFEEVGGDLSKIGDTSHFLALERVASDALRLKTLLTASNMNAAEMRARLCCPRNGAPAICEIVSAFHFYRMGAKIEWISSNAMHPEFGVQMPDISWPFSVECKRIDADAGKPLKRAHFFQIADTISEVLPPSSFSGHIHLDVETEFPKSAESLRAMGREIGGRLAASEANFGISGVAITASLQQRSRIVLSQEAITSLVKDYRSAGSLLALWSGDREGSAPLALTASAPRGNRIIAKIEKEFKLARTQLNGRSGVVNIFVENAGPGDMDRLKRSDAFNLINTKLLESERSRDILGLCYLAGPFDQNYRNANELVHEALQYRNHSNPKSFAVSFIRDG